MTRIAMVVWNEFRNDARVLKEAQTLLSVGHQVTVFALHTPGVTQARETLEEGIRVVRMTRSPLWKLRMSGPLPMTNLDGIPPRQMTPAKHVLRMVARLWTHVNLLSRIAWHRAAVVHAHDVNTLPTAWLAAKLSGAKVIYDAHEISTSREGYRPFRVLVARVERVLTPRVQGIITTTDARAKFFARAYGITRPVVLQNRPRFTASLTSTRIRDELGLCQPWPVVIYQGGLQRGRGLERLVRIAASVPKAYFVFIGGGQLAEPLRLLSQALGLEEQVRFIPTVPLADLPSYTASADIGVQPIENSCLNHFTTDSNKLFEYVIAGLPVVATDFPEIRKVVRPHSVGLLISPDSDQALRAAIKRLIDDPVLRQEFAHNAKIAARHLNWEQQERKLVELYQRVLAGHVEVHP